MTSISTLFRAVAQRAATFLMSLPALAAAAWFALGPSSPSGLDLAAGGMAALVAAGWLLSSDDAPRSVPQSVPPSRRYAAVKTLPSI